MMSRTRVGSSVDSLTYLPVRDLPILAISSGIMSMLAVAGLL